MTKLTPQQIESAAKIMNEKYGGGVGSWGHIGEYSRKLYKEAATAAAPFLQLPWDEPTSDEILRATTKDSSYSLIPFDPAKTVLLRFVNRRNTVLLYKLWRAGVMSEEQKLDAILAAIDEVE